MINTRELFLKTIEIIGGGLQYTEEVRIRIVYQGVKFLMEAIELQMWKEMYEKHVLEDH